MYTINKNKITKADLVVGIPSYNEAKTIGSVTEQVAQGLKKYFKNKKSVIINVDNSSYDGTREAFLKTKTNIPRIYISTPKAIKGKGYNFYNLFLKMQKLKAKVGIVVDADLFSIKPWWIKRMAEAIFSGFDFALPFYARKKDDATITNHLAYPLVYGLCLKDVRQPIGGEFAFSEKLLNVWLREKWTEAIKHFGIDIFMTLNAFFNKMKICQVNLKAKLHKPSTPSLNEMFDQVVETLFKIIIKNKSKIPKDNKPKKVPILGGRKLPSLENFIPDYEKFNKLFLLQFKSCQKLMKNHLSSTTYRKITTMKKKNKMKINLDLWTRLVYELLYAYYLKKNKAPIKILKCFYFGRVASFFKQTSKLTLHQTEKEIQKQAQYFLKKRDMFIKNFLK